jgi:FkbM family methyltransferase
MDLRLGDAFRLFQFVWNHPANQKRRVRALIDVFGWQLYKRGTGRYIDLALPSGLALRCYPDSASAALMLYCSCHPDYHEMRFMRHYLRAGDGFIDVGANVGVYTVYAASCVGRRGRIESLEPGPKALTRLHENIKLNGLTEVYIHPVAAGSEDGRGSFSTDRDTEDRLEMRSSRDRAVDRIDVQCVRLDSLLIGGRYAMGKMDIEGAEPLALKGAERMLEACNPPVWLLEINGSLRHYGYTEAELQDWLVDHGYELALYDSDSRHFQYPPAPWAARPNVLAIARSHREMVLRRIAESNRTDAVAERTSIKH